MRASMMLAVAAFPFCAAPAPSQETVGVSGSGTRFLTAIESKIGDQTVKLGLTGAALRKKLFFNVYTLGSYIRPGAGVRTADALAAADCPKQLHLVMERDVDGKDMADAFRTAIRLNYSAPRFEAELTTLIQAFQPHAIKKGDHLWLTHVPGVGLDCNLVGKAQFMVKDVPFARAVWEMYLGERNIDEDIKKGLVGRLPVE